MKELNGELGPGLTVVVGKEATGKTALCYATINNLSINGLVFFISDKIDANLLLCPENVFHASLKDYEAVRTLLNQAVQISQYKKVSAIVIDSITDIYRRELAGRRGLGIIFNMIKRTGIPTLVVVGGYTLFDTGIYKTNAEQLVKFASNTYIELSRGREGVLVADKRVPKLERAEFMVTAPFREIEIKK